MNPKYLTRQLKYLNVIYLKNILASFFFPPPPQGICNKRRKANTGVQHNQPTEMQVAKLGSISARNL